MSRFGPRDQACIPNRDTGQVWCVLEEGGGQRFVYSPRLGVTYCLNQEQVENGALLALLGLRLSRRVDSLEDPVVSVLTGGTHEKKISPAELAKWRRAESAALLGVLQRLYRLSHHHRWIFRPGNAPVWAWLLSRSLHPQSLNLDRIARLIAATEYAEGVSDCYPRAILTSVLCTVAGLPSNITIGIMTPTRKLHAWCSSEGQLIYEPTPRYWWFKPLADFRHGRCNED